MTVSAQQSAAWAREIGDALLGRTMPMAHVAGGDAGVALFFAYLAQYTGDARHVDEAETRLGLAIDDAGNRDPWLFSGVTGIAWTSEHLFGSVLAPNEGDINADTDGFVDALLDNPQAWHRRYELMYGLCGVGVYLLERPPGVARTGLLGKLVTALEASATRAPDGAVRWFSDYDPRFTGGTYNLGLAHGATGVIAFLARLATVLDAGDPLHARVTTLLRQTVTGFMPYRLPTHAAAVFPSFAAHAHDPSRLGWCFGDLAAAVALLAAGQALAEPAWVADATAIAIRASTRSPHSAGVVDIGLCHGAMGLAHMFRRFHAHVAEPIVAAAAERWLAHAFALRASDRGVAGIQSYLPVERVWVDDAALLGGAAGVGLALLTHAGVIAPAWDRLFLLH